MWNTLRESLFDDYFDPIIWNERNGMLVGGHYRRKVFMDEHVEEVDVVVVDYDETTHLARLFAANKALGYDDEAKRKELFNQLFAAPNFKVELTGYSLDDFNNIRLGDSVNSDELAGRDTEDERAPRDSTKLNALLATCTKPHIEVKTGEEWTLGRHVLFCGDLTTIRFENRLISLRAEHEAFGCEVYFIPCPDPYMALTDKDDLVFLMVQPDPFVASHIASNFNIEFPEEECHKV